MEVRKIEIERGIKRERERDKEREREREGERKIKWEVSKIVAE